MREYRPQRIAILFFGALALAYTGLSVIFYLGMFARRNDPDMGTAFWVTVPVLLMFLPAAGYFGWQLCSALATYRVDPQGVTRVVLGRQTQFLWRDIVDFQSRRRGLFGTIWTLTANGGRKLTIYPNAVGRSYGLESAIHAYLAPVRERKHTQIQRISQFYRYSRGQGFVLLACSLFFLCFVVVAFTANAGKPEPVGAVMLPMSVLFFGGVGALFLGLALHYFTYRVQVTPEAIWETSLFSKKVLAFPQITAFHTREQLMQTGRTQMSTEIVGQDGTKMKLHGVLIDYDTLKATLQSLVPLSAQKHGPQIVAVMAGFSRLHQAIPMKQSGPRGCVQEEKASTFPILRQDVSTITALRAELKRSRFHILLPITLWISGGASSVGGLVLLLALNKIAPGLTSGTPGRVEAALLLLACAIGYIGYWGLPATLPKCLDRRIRGQEEGFCDPQLLGGLIDMAQAIQWTDNFGQKSKYEECIYALLQRTLPEIGLIEAVPFTDSQRDFLVEKALDPQSEEEFVRIILRSAPVWGDIETLTALIMLSRTSENKAIREAAYASLNPLKVRLLAEKENAALVYSLEIPALPS